MHQARAKARVFARSGTIRHEGMICQRWGRGEQRNAPRAGCRRRNGGRGSKGRESPASGVHEGTKALWSCPGAKTWCGFPKAAHAFSRRSSGDDARSGWVSGGAGTPPPERDETADVSRRDEAQCRKRAAGREGCNGRRAAGLPCQDCGTTPHILRSAECRIYCRNSVHAHRSTRHREEGGSNASAAPAVGSCCPKTPAWPSSFPPAMHFDRFRGCHAVCGIRR